MTRIMSVWTAVLVTLESLTMAAGLMFGAVVALTPAPAHARPAVPQECASQDSPRYRAECSRYSRKGELTRTPATVAREITDGATSRCLWRVSDTTIVYCRNGERYVS